MCLAIIPSYLYELENQTSARHQHTLSLWRPVLWFDRVWASICSGPSGASHRGTTCDKWVLSGGCGVGKPTLFPFDCINRQGNGTRGEWLEFCRTRGRRARSRLFLPNDKETRRRCGGGVHHAVWAHLRTTTTLVIIVTRKKVNGVGPSQVYLSIRNPLTSIYRSGFFFLQM